MAQSVIHNRLFFCSLVHRSFPPYFHILNIRVYSSFPSSKSKKCIKATVVFGRDFACYSFSLYTCMSVLLFIINGEIFSVNIRGLSGKLLLMVVGS